MEGWDMPETNEQEEPTTDATPDDLPEEPEDAYPPDQDDDVFGDEPNPPPLRGAQARRAALQRKGPPTTAKVGGRKRQATQRIIAQEKRRKALELRKAGATYADIAQAVGYTDASAAYKAVQKAYAQIIQEPVKELKTIQVERLNHMLMVLWPKVQSGDERAIATSLQVMNKIDALMGTEAADRVDVNINQKSAILVVDGNKDDYIAALKRMSGAGVQADGTNARQIEQQPRGPVYPPGMGVTAIGQQPEEVVVEGHVLEGRQPQQDDESVQHPTEAMVQERLDTPPPQQPKRFHFGVDPTVRRSE